MSMYIDYKVTVWQRLDIPDGAKKNKLRELVKQGNHIEIDEYLQEINEPAGDFPSWDYITETDEYLHPEDNGGEPTIELWDNGKLTTTNRPKPKSSGRYK